MIKDMAFDEIAQDIIQSVTTYSKNKNYMRYIEGLSDVTKLFNNPSSAGVTTYDLGAFNLDLCNCCKKPLLVEKETGFFYNLNQDEAAVLIYVYFWME